MKEGEKQRKKEIEKNKEKYGNRWGPHVSVLEETVNAKLSSCARKQVIV